MDAFFDMTIEFQVGTTVALCFLFFSLLLLWFKRGIAMQFTLLISFLSCLIFCRLPMVNWVGHGLLTMFVYFWIWDFLLKRFIKASAKEQLEKEWKLYSSDYETAPADPFEFMWLDLDYYDTKQRELESLGFQKVHDIELLPQTRAFPETRTFSRSFINIEQDIGADIIQIRMVKPKNMLERSVDVRMIIFATEFSDGTFLETHNTKGVNPITEVEGIVLQMFEPNTPLEDLLDAHEEKIETICETKNVEVILHRTVQELSAAGEREFLLFRKDRQKKGGFTEAENARSMHIFGNQNSDDAATQAYLSEYAKQARKIARKQRKKQENETPENNMF
ncbi:MAG: hypothetical protein LBC02_13195 [Planctomycetaceae bacterium]|jgi:hypothetical protein|nr:hypothetical protein [Planctomycetaceae bacterium]